mmetsp:Transcript_15519/g.31472  ORF Transcript_15519/g.31472 Transcript_15519/m.31472 type:complete len:87 (-) Transcript_15519:36-296(-)
MIVDCASVSLDSREIRAQSLQLLFDLQSRYLVAEKLNVSRECYLRIEGLCLTCSPLSLGIKFFVKRVLLTYLHSYRPSFEAMICTQ